MQNIARYLVVYCPVREVVRSIADNRWICISTIQGVSERYIFQVVIYHRTLSVP